MKWSIPSHIIDEARGLVDDGRVLKVVPNETDQIWQGEVLDNKLYYVALDGGPKEHDQCQCDIWEKRGFCPHTVAVELFMRDHDVVRVMKFSQQPLFRYPEIDENDQTAGLDVILENYHNLLKTNYQFSNHDKAGLAPLTIKIELYESGQYDYLDLATNHIYMRLKLGLKGGAHYYIQDFEDFFKSFSQEGLYLLSKRKQSMVLLKASAFDEDSYRLLKTLAQDYLHELDYLTDVAHAGSSKQIRQFYYLNHSQLRKILNYYSQGKYQVSYFVDDDRVDIQVLDRGAPNLLDYQQLAENNFLITMPKQIKIFIYYGMLRIDNHIYLYDQLHYPDFQDLLFVRQNLEEVNYQLELDQEGLDHFTSLFGRPVLKFGTIKGLDLLSPPILNQDKLDVLVYLDSIGHGLQAQLVYQYGRTRFSEDYQLEKIDDQQLVVRDIRAEFEAENIMKMLGFTWHNRQLQWQGDSLEDIVGKINDIRQLVPASYQLVLTNNLRYLNKRSFQSQIKVDQDQTNRLLSINFSVTDVNPRDVDYILKAIEQEDRYLRLEDGQLINIDQVVAQDQHQILSRLYQNDQAWENGQAIPVYQAIGFADMLSDSQAFQNLYQDLVNPSYPIDIQALGFQTALADYQQYALQWLMSLAKYQLGGLLADEMGLGKTVQMIAFILALKDKQPDLSVLVVGPASVLYNWDHEIKRFAPSLASQVIDGDIDERENLRRDNAEKIWITSYQSYRNDQAAYQALHFDLLIIDEAQAIKNDSTLLYQALKQQAAKTRIALSGTPLENHLDEFWALMNIVLPGLLPDKRHYKTLSIDEIKQLTRPFVLRRTKQEVALQLPGKEVFDKYTQLSKEQKSIYLAYLKDIQSQLNHEQGPQKVTMELLAGITRLRQICCHPKLVNPDYEASSGKFEYFKEYLSRALNEGRRILVFSQFTAMLEIIAQYLDQEEIAYMTLTGQTKKTQRQADIDAFNQGHGDVYLISLKAGGAGINLTGADTVFMYDLWWNPAVEEQAIGRAHRIGQTKEVSVYRFISEGTIEQRMSELQEEKRQLFDSLFNQEDSQVNHKITIEDLRYILDIPQ
ncbi:hypothetical protein AWM75_01980 [Aerococcus urinaehominis]|uniref:Uncharacterized protein n=1 Tax=Aerococcus urinaehominis TaxID=128944 RepID=A0A0X8FK73_9LACT|nr:DEAD/DEAH box helicase [Aerococcus urinaehominis]AMB98836.1 hypothetical protein AWM75_01980 [Aerococcus urinaehominis]SDM17775.1 Helicase conserved C-terminal domain-containing protein [Aerococcus urinaehominis]